MKKKIRYIVFFIIVIIIGAVIPGTLTRAKYYTSITMQSGLDIGYMIFNIYQIEEDPSTYELCKGEDITAKYKLTNKDANNYINKLDLKYYIKIADENNEEQSIFDITLDGYNYLHYNIDGEGNIIDENGNIVDIDGKIVEERKLTEEENAEIQSQLETIKKGYGPIELAYDGETLSEVELNFKIKCPETYTGNSSVNLKIQVIAEEISNTKFIYTEEADLKISIVEENNNKNTNNQEINTLDRNNSILNLTSNDTNEILQNENNTDSNEIVNNSTNDNVEDTTCTEDNDLKEVVNDKTLNTEEPSNNNLEGENTNDTNSNEENTETNNSDKTMETENTDTQNTNEIV